MRKPVLLRVAIALPILIAAQQTRATIILVGTQAEKDEIQGLIDDLKANSATANAGFTFLEQHQQNIRITFGRAPFGGVSLAGPPRLIILDKNAISCFNYIEGPNNNNGAEAGSSLGIILAHEAIGHQANALDGAPSGEAAAVATTNRIRSQLGLVQRKTKDYLKRRSRRFISEFSDESKVDFTNAIRKANQPQGGADPNGMTSRLIDTSATIQLVGTSGPNGGIVVSLDPSFINQSITADVSEYDTGTQVVSLDALSVTLEPSADTDGPNLDVADFAMSFGSLELDGGLLTGTNTASLAPIGRGAGDWDFTGALADFSFEIGGMFPLSNPLFDVEGDPGLAVENIIAEMHFDTNSGTWFGEATLDGVLAARAPSPGTLSLPALAAPCLLRRRRHRRPSDRSV